MGTLLDRINIFVGAENLSPSALSKRLGLPQNSVNYYLKGERKLSIEFVEKLIIEFPLISVSWLMRGKGDMYVNTDPDKCSNAELAYYKSLAELRSMHVQTLEKDLAKLRVELADMKAQLKESKRGIA